MALTWANTLVLLLECAQTRKPQATRSSTLSPYNAGLTHLFVLSVLVGTLVGHERMMRICSSTAAPSPPLAIPSSGAAASAASASSRGSSPSSELSPSDLTNPFAPPRAKAVPGARRVSRDSEPGDDADGASGDHDASLGADDALDPLAEARALRKLAQGYALQACLMCADFSTMAMCVV